MHEKKHNVFFLIFKKQYITSQYLDLNWDSYTNRILLNVLKNVTFQLPDISITSITSLILSP